MKRDIRSFLADIDEAAVRIMRYIKDLTFDDYQSNHLIQDSVERNFITIGEALNKLQKADPELAESIPNLRKIIDFRNLLTHGYFRIQPKIVWAAAIENLPVLHDKIKHLLATLGKVPKPPST
ncbi:MAG: DUF86 domain-containing protein [Paracoccaceae bacterium]|nr:DUF86 domain-containing protein [Paracoccaceae bacterium]MDE2673707.1 DUF86 domain-containing protein [Paracoccaceae bacterium]